MSNSGAIPLILAKKGQIIEGKYFSLLYNLSFFILKILCPVIESYIVKRIWHFERKIPRAAKCSVLIMRYEPIAFKFFIEFALYFT